MRIVFFGTPVFAVPSLRALLGEGFPVEAVVTQPDRPTGRSRSALSPPPVKEVAVAESIPVHQPERPSAPEFLPWLKDLAPDLGVVVAYGHILSSAVLNVPRRGMINVHASLLPLLRGAAPIQHAILEGHEKSGITIMQMTAGMDAGPVLHQLETPIPPDETHGELQARLAELGALGLVEVLTLMSSPTGVEQVEQDARHATFAPKITRDNARVGWNQPADTVARVVRAMDPMPGAWTVIDGRAIKLFGPQIVEHAEAAPGTVLDTTGEFVVATARGALRILDVQPAGKRRLPAREGLRGAKIPTGTRCL